MSMTSRMIASDLIIPLVTEPGRARLSLPSDAVYCLQYINKYARLEVTLQFVHVQQFLIEFVHAYSLTSDQLLY